MASVNKVILVGNLGRDPEVRHSPDGMAVCSVSVATTTSWKDKSTGEKRDDTEWHRVVFYNRLAEVAGEYLKKGSSIYIEGKLKTRKYQDKKTGADKTSTEIVADQMQMLGGRDANGFESSQPAQLQQRPARQQRQPEQQYGAASIQDMTDDIPF